MVYDRAFMLLDNQWIFRISLGKRNATIVIFSGALVLVGAFEYGIAQFIVVHGGTLCNTADPLFERPRGLVEERVETLMAKVFIIDFETNSSSFVGRLIHCFIELDWIWLMTHLECIDSKYQGFN